MKTLNDLAMAYLEEIEKNPAELSALRVVEAPTKPNDKMRFTFEFDFYNGFVTYTRVGIAMVYQEGIMFLHPTARTRLSVPAEEVPDGAVVWTMSGRGPYGVFYEDDVDVYILHNDHSTQYVVARGDFVSIPCYYAKGEGVIAGGVVLATDEQMMDAINGNGDSPEDWVNGCKFDMWALAYNLATGKDSVFHNEERMP